MKRTNRTIIALVSAATVLAGLMGCVGNVAAPRGGEAHMEPSPVYVESPIAVQPDYVYYPDYEVYYSSNTRQYVYRDGRSWVTRGAPPWVSADVLFASPSVSLRFHDSPSFHHAEVMRRYPGHRGHRGSPHSQNESLNNRN